ncbi:N-formylglutamate amidohydrolase [Ideonella sp. DXS22W]|uniref:N-formylglutamate amidohydrolase n=1 Tax=Pseudaquabacterium inlustre TaxID=2984192 RepID=A0ABU9CJM9_9BURK
MPLRAPACWPPWVVIHLPHDAVTIPPAVRGQFVLDEVELAAEVGRMTDHCTQALFVPPAEAGGGVCAVRAAVSRLVVDVERFADDHDEPMAARGMGVIYTRTADGQALRRPLAPAEREALLAEHYRPHHARLEAAVASALSHHGRCLVIDAHSFPAKALPYEQADAGTPRPDICIGTDDFHTPPALAHAFVSAFAEAGWRVAVNQPFAGALVPASRYHRDIRVAAVMVEVNRGLYLDEAGTTPLAGFRDVARRVQRACARGALDWAGG